MTLLVLLCSLYLLLQTPAIQTWLGKKLAAAASKELRTSITVDRVEFSLLNRVALKGLLVRDRQEDTLAYAGTLRIKLSDWFWAKDSIDLTHLDLADAVIKLSRKDSVWHHQFLLDYFGTSPQGSSSSNTNKPIHLHRLLLERIRFEQRDEWKGQSLEASVNTLQLVADRLSSEDKYIQIRTLLIDRPQCRLSRFTALQPVTSADTTPATNDWLLDGSRIALGQLNVSNGRLTIADQGHRPTPGRFDERYVDVRDIDLSLNDTRFSGDTLSSNLLLSARERSGFRIKKLKGRMLLSPTRLAVDSLLLETGNSRLRQWITLDFSKLSDLARWNEKVKIEGQLASSLISSKDLAYFFPGAASFKKDIQVSAAINGNPLDLSVTALQVKAGNESFLEGSLQLQQLQDANKAFVRLKAKRLNTSYEDLVFLFPSLKKLDQPRLSALRYVRFQGELSGTRHLINAQGNWQTGLGSLFTRMQLQWPSAAAPRYRGELSLIDFDAGKLLGSADLNKINFTGSINGSGLSLPKMQAAADGTIGSITFNGYTYRNIRIEGSLRDALVSCNTSIQDPNLQTGALQALFWIDTRPPHFQFSGNIQKAQLQRLGWSDRNVEVAGQVTAVITRPDLDKLEGSVAFRQATITIDDELLPMDSLVLIARYTEAQQELLVRSNEFSAALQGQFRLSQLPQLAQDWLAGYYPSQSLKTRTPDKDIHLQFSMQTAMASPVLSLLAPGWSGLNFSNIQAEWWPQQDRFLASIKIPELRYHDYRVSNFSLESSGTNTLLSVKAGTSEISINDSLRLPAITLNASAQQDSTRVQLRTSTGNGVEKVNLNALIKTYTDGFALLMEPSDFTINGKSWTIGEEGELVLRKNTPLSGNLLLAEGDQQIRIQTLPATPTQPDYVSIDLTNINLNDVAPFFLPDNRLEGLVSGRVLIQDPVGDLRISTDQLDTRLLRLDNDSIGDIRAQVLFDSKKGQLTAKGATRNEEENLSFDVSVFTADSMASQNKIDLKAKQYPITILERFLGDIFSDISGYLTGDVNIAGELDRPAVYGKGMLKDAGLRVNYTQCYYRLQDKAIELTPQRIDLNGMVLIDTVTGNPVYVTGGINHNSFYNLVFDVDIATRKPGTRGEQENRPVQLLRTTRADNDLFYGDVKGTASLQLRGPQSDLTMSLNAIASDKDSSFVTLPPGSSRESGMADFLVERKYGKEMEEEDYGSSGDNLLFDIELTATPWVQLKVVLDELTGDEIKGKGSGTLKIRSGTTEPLSLRGRLGIEEGNYLFTFQSFFKKPFEIKKGSDNYIEWNGDPYDANIKFEAIYKSDRVSFAPLASTLNLTSEVSNARSDVYVVARLTDKLFKPAIAFALDFPPNSVAVSNPELALLLRQLQSNTNELNRQVTYLIVFNSFAPNELGGSLSGAGVNVSTISGILLSVLSDQINKLFSNLLRSDKYRINLNTSLYNRNLLASNSTALTLGSNVNFSIGRSFFDNRFIISTGLGMDAPLGQGAQSSIQQSILLLPDVTMEWLINPSGTIRASFFYRTNADYLTASTSASVVRSRRAGASLSYRREFDRLADIFARKKKKAVK